MNDNQKSPSAQVKDELFKMFSQTTHMLGIAMRAIPRENPWFDKLIKVSTQGDDISIIAQNKNEFEMQDVVMILKWLNITNFYITSTISELEEVKEQAGKPTDTDDLLLRESQKKDKIIN